jgi:hypothetical protein
VSRRALQRKMNGRRGISERGVETLEWIGLSALVLTLLLGILSTMPAGGQAVGAEMHSTISTWVEAWSGAGGPGAGPGHGSFSARGEYSHTAWGQMQGSLPGLGQPDYSLGPDGTVTGVGLVGPTTDQQGNVLGAADGRPWWQRAFGGLWGMIISPFRPAGAGAITEASSGTADPGGQFVDAMQEGLSKAVGAAERFSLIKHLVSLSSQGTLAQPSPLGISGAALQMAGIVAPFDPYLKMAIWGIGFAVSNYDEPPATLLP